MHRGPATSLDAVEQGDQVTAMGSWTEGAAWWHVYPLGFVGAEQRASECNGIQRRFGQITAWLDYAVKLDVTGILLGPIFASSTHGYDTVDYFKIDPRLGDDEDFDAFIKGADARGLRVILDGVFNHVGEQFPVFQRALQMGPTSEEARWFHFTWPSPGQSDSAPEYASFEGHRHLVTLNHAEPLVKEHVTSVMDYWLDRGAAGWRLDAAYAVPRSFWKDILPNLRARQPDAYLFGEVIHGDYIGFVRETGVDSVTQYELWKAIWSSLNDRNLHELAWALKRHNAMLDHFQPQTFIGNHDVTRIASQLKDERHIAHAVVILLTIGGLPSIYSGDEQAFRGVKEHRMGGDDAVRPAFPPNSADLLPFGWDTFRLHQELIAIRRKKPWLARAQSQLLEVRNTELIVRVSHADRVICIVLNIGDAPIVRQLDAKMRCIAGEVSVTQDGPTTTVRVPSHSWGILEPI
jgi:glycosidase